MFIAIEGLDGSGKATQVGLLTERLKGEGREVLRLSYPNYGSACCQPVEMYLSGQFGDKPDAVNAYTASMLFAVDRYADYKTRWQGVYEEGKTVIVADRYVQSNMIHQLCKLPREQWKHYIAWLEELEYECNGLPKPDLTIYLRVAPVVSQRLLAERNRGTVSSKDIHEGSLEYLERCDSVGITLAEHYNWRLIDCDDGAKLLTIEEIAERIDCVVKKYEKASTFTLKT